jgi:hypothetical protein
MEDSILMTRKTRQPNGAGNGKSDLAILGVEFTDGDVEEDANPITTADADARRRHHRRLKSVARARRYGRFAGNDLFVD